MRDYIKGEILGVKKPKGWTSFNVVARLRNVLTRRLSVKRLKVGHAGTLDPLASGVMIVTTGRSTKLIDTLQSGVKEYVADIALGATTPSFDLETPIDATYPTAHITRELVEETLSRFVGRIEQVPPVFSAVKIDGRRAYSFARKGKDVELKPKILEISELELLDFSPEKIRVRVVCSKGTYIRALARDIGEALDSGAHLTDLLRTRVGDFTLDRCMTVDEAVDLIANGDTAPVPDDYPHKRNKSVSAPSTDD